GIFDLLIVIDNSSSMGPYQNRLSHTLPSILRYISNTNWRIAVVTSTSPCLVKTDDKRRYITRADFDRDPVATEADFKKLTMIGEGGDPIEKGIKMMTDAMTSSGCSSESNDWLRANSQRSILLLTDEKNCGSGDTNEGCPGAPWETASYFFDRVGFNVPVNAFLLLQEPPRIDPNNPNDPNRDCENSGGYLNPPNPSEYVRLVQETGGIYNDVCRANYQTVLEQISQNVRKKVNIQFELSYPAVSTSLDVSIDGKKVNSFTVSGKTLTILETVNETAQTITVNYKHDPVPMLKNFMPQHSHDSASIDVFINGEALAKNLYHYN
ncbi:MAG: VWA domain-containing protein, partial [Proteobacteria bacterium]|nr:VWA domain-containing protein [Pseudomonadota bacterium]